MSGHVGLWLDFYNATNIVKNDDEDEESENSSLDLENDQIIDINIDIYENLVLFYTTNEI